MSLPADPDVPEGSGGAPTDPPSRVPPAAPPAVPPVVPASAVPVPPAVTVAMPPAVGLRDADAWSEEGRSHQGYGRDGVFHLAPPSPDLSPLSTRYTTDWGDDAWQQRIDVDALWMLMQGSRGTLPWRTVDAKPEFL